MRNRNPSAVPAGASVGARPRRHPWRSLTRAASWHRRKLAVVAALAAVLSGIAAAQPAGPATIDVVRAKRQLSGGAVLSAADLMVDRVVAADAPDGSLHDPQALLGSRLTGPIARRQVLTSLDLTSTRVGLAAGHVLAPIRLADPEVVALLEPGQQVDVLAASAETVKAAVIARSVRVVTVPRADENIRAPDAGALILVDVDAEAATDLARAAATNELTVIWR